MGECLSRVLAECFHLVCRRFDAPIEHLNLDSSAVEAAVLGHPRSGHRLHDPVDVSRHRIGVRPQRHVDLLRMREFGHDCRDPLKE
ncbi:MAG: hypothetical protein H0U30_07935 [Actinobacteria bacterium]|nr:hypothetical protein [Actinomycetota bacterium]